MAIHSPLASWRLLVRGGGFVACALVMLAPVAARAQNLPPLSHRLKLTARIENQEYCLQPDGRTTLRLALRFDFENVSRRKILLWQKSDTVDGLDLVAIPPGAPPRPWPHITFDRIAQRHADPFPPFPGEDYYILKPGRIFHTKGIVHIDLLHSGLAAGGPVAPGKYSLKITVATWPDSQSDAESARQSWAHSGYLESDDVLSEPVDFTISSNPDFRDCGWSK